MFTASFSLSRLPARFLFLPFLLAAAAAFPQPEPCARGVKETESEEARRGLFTNDISFLRLAEPFFLPPVTFYHIRVTDLAGRTPPSTCAFARAFYVRSKKQDQ